MTLTTSSFVAMALLLALGFVGAFQSTNRQSVLLRRNSAVSKTGSPPTWSSSSGKKAFGGVQSSLSLPLLPQYASDEDAPTLLHHSHLRTPLSLVARTGMANDISMLDQYEEDDSAVTAAHAFFLNPAKAKDEVDVAALASSDLPFWCYSSTAFSLAQAGKVGSITGFVVVIFKLAIEAVRSLCYEQDFLAANHHMLIPLIPALGGAIVGLLMLAGGPFAPGMKGTIEEVDQLHLAAARDTTASADTKKEWFDSIGDHFRIQGNVIRKSLAAVATLGSGCSLGPEGPCVELGMNVARACTEFNHQKRKKRTSVAQSSLIMDETIAAEATEEEREMPYNHQEREWNRVLLSCGAAAGVSAGFNAPIAGVFFALEIMQKAFSSMDAKNELQQQEDALNSNDDEPGKKDNKTLPNRLSNILSTASTTTITPLLLASVLSALISQNFLGDHLVLIMTHFNVNTPLTELPLYLTLGGLSGVVAFLFNHATTISHEFFSGDAGPIQVRKTMSSIPKEAKPMIGGLLCGIVGLFFPQILFFGYETLNSLLLDNSIPMEMALSLLLVKGVMTAISAGSGLVGGTFALALFLGAMLGSAFQGGTVHAIETLMNWNLVDHPVLDAMTFGALSSNHFLSDLVQNFAIPNSLEIAGLPAYAMVGAASVLSALFRAPLTASLLMFEVTRSYDAILPLLASAGVASIVGDMLEHRFYPLQTDTKKTPSKPCSFPIIDLDVIEENEGNIDRGFNAVRVPENP